MKFVYVLLTCDIHTHSHPAVEVNEDLNQARTTLGEFGLPCTFLFHSSSAELLPDQVIALRQEGHEIGCHGVTHELRENFSILPLAEQQRLLTKATNCITDILGERPMTFRAPVFKISGHTIQVLQELGYQADLSVVAQRIGIFGSDIYNFRPLFAPRRPYHPSTKNAYKRGTGKLWEIPVSALGLPFLSNTERLLGLSFIKIFFRMLYLEAQLIDKPIVFVFHAEDLNQFRKKKELRRLSWKDFLPLRDHGFLFRSYLLELNWRFVHRDMAALFCFMKSFPSVRFLTVQDYLLILSQLKTSKL